MADELTSEIGDQVRGWTTADFQAQGMCGSVSPDGKRVCVLHPDLVHLHEWDTARRFVLDRIEDMTGVSGIGTVAWGVVFPDGTVAMRWNTEWTSTAVYESMEHVEHVHLHHGATQVVWLDE